VFDWVIFQDGSDQSWNSIVSSHHPNLDRSIRFSLRFEFHIDSLRIVVVDLSISN
jgi:hypothetical protein